ncbi:hypothetical protein BDW62DRAFT_89580 [Aspergillus aurantiobrunneus]
MHLQQDQAYDASIPPLLSTTITTYTSPVTPPQSHLQHQSTVQETKHLYFAYGSNLSPTQMRVRCTHNPTLSAHPVAIAALDSWRWLICQNGYANVVPPAGLRIGPQSVEGDAVQESVSDSIPHGGVYGVLYELSAEDERVLDGHEEVDHCSGLSLAGSGADGMEGKVGIGVPAEIRPRDQGNGSYNKWYLGARVVKWLDEEYRERNGFEGEGGEVKVLVYIDELRVRVAKPKNEYVPRMNRAIKEAVGLGFPQDWAEEVMRPSIPLEHPLD